METITVPREELKALEEDNKRLKAEVDSLRNTKLYKRLLECLENLKKKEYTRKDLGI